MKSRASTNHRRRPRRTDVVSTRRAPLYRGPGSILPSRMIVTLTNSSHWSIPNGLVSSSSGNYCSIVANDTFAPFNSPYNPSRTSGIAPMNGGAINGTSTTQSALGLLSLEGLYKFVRVLRYRIRVRVLSQGSSDNMAVCVFPLGTNDVPNLTFGFNLWVASGQPGCQRKDFIFGSEMKEIVQSSTAWDNLAIRRSQYIDSPQTATGASLGSFMYAAYVGIFLQILDGSVNTNSVPFEITLEQECEFSGLINQIA